MSVGASCKKHVAIPPVDQLPAATQKGANTFGCLLNGNLFLAKVPALSTLQPLQCSYAPDQYGSGYDFKLSAVDGSGVQPTTIEIYGGNLTTPLSAGETIALDSFNVAGKASAQYTNPAGDFLPDWFYQTQPPKYIEGLTILYLDIVKRIISGTFEFNAISPGGKVVKIADGRFDVTY